MNLKTVILQKIDKDFLIRLSKVSNLKSALILGFDFLAIGTIILASLYVNHWAIYVVSVMLIANRQHSLLIAMHDASHGKLFTNPTLNDWLCEILCAWSMFFSMFTYRENHRLHHLHANTDLDPDFRPERFPTSRRQIYRMLVTDVLGLNTFQQLGEAKRFRAKSKSKLFKFSQILFYILLVTALTYFGAWKIYLLYWVIPLFTWLKVILRLRAIADHAGVNQQETPFDTRTVIPTVLDRLFVAPRQCSYHFGHHLLQSIPSYHLKEFHYKLMELPESDRSTMRVTRGFHQLIFEFPA